MNKFELDRILDMENEFDKFLDNRDEKLPLVLYGAGVSSVFAIRAFAKYNVKIEYICDSNMKKCGTEHYGLQVVSIDEMIRKYKDFIVVIAVPSYEIEIREYLSRFIEKNRIYCFAFTPELIYKDERIRYKQNLKKLNSNLICIFDRLYDDKSKLTFENILKARITFNTKYYQQIRENEQYFSDDIIKLTDKEVFIDGGAFIGDTVKEFAEKTKGIYKAVYSFEPDKEIFQKLKEVQTVSGFLNINLFNIGLYSSKSVLHFNNDMNELGAACIENNDKLDCIIETDSIDNLIKEKITFIKLDIEGSEMEALIGARETIKKYKPKLAICVYHKLEDIVDIIEYIMDLNLEYRYYLRHYSGYKDETVFYAV